MSIPANITAALNSLEAQVAAAQPLIDVNHQTVVAMQLNAGNLVALIQTALTAISLLDSWVAPIDPVSIINGVLSRSSDATDQSNLALMRGVVGRATSNLDQLV